MQASKAALARAQRAKASAQVTESSAKQRKELADALANQLPAGTGIAIVTYSTNASGVALMSCMVHGSNIIDSPSNVHVQASGFSASMSSFLTKNVVAVAGSSFGIDLAIADHDGNRWVVNPFSDSSDGTSVADVKISGPSSISHV